MSNLWVGNVALDVREADLTNLFGRYGAIDNITVYSSKFFAFVNFQRPEDAQAAKEALNGTVFHGNPLKIDFAKLAKPCNSLWVGGIGPSVTRERLEEHFSKFGEIKEFRFNRDKSIALVSYLTVENATEALHTLNGSRIGGSTIRVDYLRSLASRKEQPDFGDGRDPQFVNRSTGASSPGIVHDVRDLSVPHGSIRPQRVQSSIGPKGDGQPSNVLWVSYPPSFVMDEKMLYNAMILFGEIEGIASFSSQNYSLVEFRSVEEAKRAKEGLEGRLFNDPRILIMYSNSGLAPSKDENCSYPGIKRPRTDVLLSDTPGRPVTIPNIVRGFLPPHGVSGPDMPMRPLVPQGSFHTPLQQGPDTAYTKIHNLQESNSNILMDSSSRNRLSPSPGLLPSPSQAIKPVSGAWDVFDASQVQRETKKPRVGGFSTQLDPSLDNMDTSGLGLNQFQGRGLQVDADISGSGTNVRGMNYYSPVDARVVTRGNGRGHPDPDCIWRGVIAKGGTPVCRARCVPVDKEFDFEIPEVVNCSARTGLDMLAKHFSDAAGYNVIFFLPDSEEDFAPYTEFLRYLSAKSRAGVAKFGDGTTLFLVPPSDFLRRTLKIAGPECLYGIVLNFQNLVHGSMYGHTNLAQQPYMPPSVQSKVMPQEEGFVQTAYDRSFLDDANTFSNLRVPPTSNPAPVQAVQATSTSFSPTGVTLTPELIASLASLFPTKGNTSNAQPSSGSSNATPMLTPPTDRVQPQGWELEQTEGPNHSGHPINHFGNQHDPQVKYPSELHYSVSRNAPSDAAKGFTANNQIPDPTFNTMRYSDTPSMQTINFAPRPQGERYYVSQDVNHQYPLGTPEESRQDVQGNTVSGESQTGQPPQSYSGPVQGTDRETERHDIYQSTLQFVASLLQQVKQPPTSEAAQRSGNK